MYVCVCVCVCVCVGDAYILILCISFEKGQIKEWAHFKTTPKSK